MADEIKSGEATGRDVTPSLASLTDMLLRMKVSESVIVEKRSEYLRPKNINFLKAPRVNKPIWDTLNAFTRVKESGLQSVQNDFLNSAVPIIRVMEKIHDAKDNMASLDASDLLATLKDFFCFWVMLILE